MFSTTSTLTASDDATTVLSAAAAAADREIRQLRLLARAGAISDHEARWQIDDVQTRDRPPARPRAHARTRRHRHHDRPRNPARRHR